MADTFLKVRFLAESSWGLFAFVLRQRRWQSLTNPAKLLMLLFLYCISQSFPPTLKFPLPPSPPTRRAGGNSEIFSKPPPSLTPCYCLPIVTRRLSILGFLQNGKEGEQGVVYKEISKLTIQVHINMIPFYFSIHIISPNIEYLAVYSSITLLQIW